MARKTSRRAIASTSTKSAKAKVAAARRQLREAERRLRELERETAKQRRTNKRYKAKGLSYWRRLAKGLRAGKTRQQSRGHKPQEHITRAAHAKAEGRLTSAQKQRINRFAKAQSERANTDYADMRDAMLDFAEQDGFAEFETLMRQQRKLRREYVKGDYHQIYTNMDVFENSFDIPDISWMYYH